MISRGCSDSRSSAASPARRRWPALPAILPEVTGTAYITGTSEFFFDPDDPLREGFLL